MKRFQKLAVLCALTLLSGADAAFAETVSDPDFSDVLVLYSDDAPDAQAEEPLSGVINYVRAARGALPLVQSEVLDQLAAQRAAALEQNGGGADGNALSQLLSAPASETVIRGKADLNTMLSALLLSEPQMQNLAYSRYAEFGVASNESETLWVLLLSEPSAYRPNGD